LLLRCQNQNSSETDCNLVCRARLVWGDILTWINVYLFSTYFSEDPELRQDVVKKLDRISLEYESMLKLIFGDQIAEDYAVLFSDYLNLLMNLINAEQNEDENAANDYKRQLVDNSMQRADFLSTINPFWQKKELELYMKNYTDLLIDHIDAFSKKDFRKNVSLYDQILYYSTAMGDSLAKGVFQYMEANSKQPIHFNRAI